MIEIKAHFNIFCLLKLKHECKLSYFFSLLELEAVCTQAIEIDDRFDTT